MNYYYKYEEYEDRLEIINKIKNVSFIKLKDCGNPRRYLVLDNTMKYLYFSLKNNKKNTISEEEFIQKCAELVPKKENLDYLKEEKIYTKLPKLKCDFVKKIAEKSDALWHNHKFDSNLVLDIISKRECDHIAYGSIVGTEKPCFQWNSNDDVYIRYNCKLLSNDEFINWCANRFPKKEKSKMNKLQECINNKIWLTAMSKKIPIAEMETDYILRCINMVKTRKYSNMEVRDPYIPLLIEELQKRFEGKYVDVKYLTNTWKGYLKFYDKYNCYMIQNKNGACLISGIVEDLKSIKLLEEPKKEITEFPEEGIAIKDLSKEGAENIWSFLQNKIYKYPDAPVWDEYNNSIVLYKTAIHLRYYFRIPMKQNQYQCKDLDEFKELTKLHPKYKDYTKLTNHSNPWKEFNIKKAYSDCNNHDYGSPGSGPSGCKNNCRECIYALYDFEELEGKELKIEYINGKVEELEYRNLDTLSEEVSDINKIYYKEKENCSDFSRAYNAFKNISINFDEKNIGKIENIETQPMKKINIDDLYFINFDLNKEKEQMLNCKEKEEMTGAEYTVCYPGANKDNTKINLDKEENTIRIDFPEPVVCCNHQSLGTNDRVKTIKVPKRYDLSTTKAVIKDGVITINVNVCEDRAVPVEVE